jgi:hypothetical protein
MNQHETQVDEFVPIPTLTAPDDQHFFFGAEK